MKRSENEKPAVATHKIYIYYQTALRRMNATIIAQVRHDTDIILSQDQADREGWERAVLRRWRNGSAECHTCRLHVLHAHWSSHGNLAKRTVAMFCGCFEDVGSVMNGIFP